MQGLLHPSAFYVAQRLVGSLYALLDGGFEALKGGRAYLGNPGYGRGVMLLLFRSCKGGYPYPLPLLRARSGKEIWVEG